MGKFRYRAKTRRGLNFKRIRRIVRAVTLPVVAKRVIFDTETISPYTTNAYDTANRYPLLLSQENTNEEQEADGTSPAEVTIGSRIVSLKLNFAITATQTGEIFRWMLLKYADGEELTTSLVDAWFHSSDDTPSLRELKKLTLAKGILYPGASNLTAFLRIFVKRKALARNAILKENDKIVLVVASNKNTSLAKLHGFGTIWVALN